MNENNGILAELVGDEIKVNVKLDLVTIGYLLIGIFVAVVLANIVIKSIA